MSASRDWIMRVPPHADSLRVVIVGMNPSETSGGADKPYACGTNSMWSELAAAGLVELPGDQNATLSELATRRGVAFIDLAPTSTSNVAAVVARPLAGPSTRADVLARLQAALPAGPPRVLLVVGEVVSKALFRGGPRRVAVGECVPAEEAFDESAWLAGSGCVVMTTYSTSGRVARPEHRKTRAEHFAAAAHLSRVPAPE
jgi:hypothetical protein